MIFYSILISTSGSTEVFCKQKHQVTLEFVSLLELEDRHFALCFPFLEIAVRKEKKKQRKKN
jgi:hypothetical protein